MGLVIDTSALVAVERSSTSWEAALASIVEEPAAISAIVYAELIARTIHEGLAPSLVEARPARARRATRALPTAEGVSLSL